MPPTPDWNKYIDAGAEFVALTRSQARKRASELVAQGQLAQNQVQSFVDDLVEDSRRRTDDLLDVVRVEIQRQVKTLGIATKDDLAKLESRLTGKPFKPSSTAKSPKLAAGKRAARDGAKRAAKAEANMSAGARKATKQSSAKKSSAASSGAKKSSRPSGSKSSAKKASGPSGAQLGAKNAGAAKKAAS